MEKKMETTLNAGKKIGTIVGGILFIFFGLLPGIYFGGYMAVILVSSIVGGPVEPGVFSKTAIVVGVLIGTLGALAVFLVGGSLVGMALGYVAEMLSGKKDEEPAIKDTEIKKETNQ